MPWSDPLVVVLLLLLSDDLCIVYKAPGYDLYRVDDGQGGCWGTGQLGSRLDNEDGNTILFILVRLFFSLNHGLQPVE